jgi:2-oxoglutarate dehydrogenase complex dehydrogenase (E1) component-like enzyme
LREREIEHIALIRVEQLYPVPDIELSTLIHRYAGYRKSSGRRMNREIKALGDSWRIICGNFRHCRLNMPAAPNRQHRPPVLPVSTNPSLKVWSMRL